MEVQFFSRPNDSFDNALMASQANNYISYDGMDHANFDRDKTSPDRVFLYSESDQEASLIRKDLMNALSPDTKFVLRIIDTEPEKVSTPETKNITTVSLIRFLAQNHWHQKRVARVFQEMKTYLSDVY